MTREERYIEYDERIDRYLRKQMDDSEQVAFEQEVDSNQELRERLVATAMLVKGISQAGMQREGQAQLDAIKQMNRDGLIQTTKSHGNRKPMWSIMKWASGIAAVAIIALGIYTLYPSREMKQAEPTATVKEPPIVHDTPQEQAEPTLADLADEYNKPFSSEPDEFASIRQQIEKGNGQDMMALVNDIDKIEWPTAKHGPKGADDDDETIYTTDNFNDCTHWYKALAYLKADDKESTVKELNELIEYGKNSDLTERATDLLKKLEK